LPGHSGALPAHLRLSQKSAAGGRRPAAGVVDGIVSNQSPKHGVIQSRLKLQMQADALQPLNSGLDEDAPEEPLNVKEIFTPETIEEATHFLRLNAQDRLRLVLAYLRDKHAYCFWCGTQYDGPDEMDEQCPGPEEDAHD